MRTYCKFFNYLKYVKIVLWHRIWSILVNIPCALEKKGICVLILLDGIFYRSHLDPFGRWWYSVLSFTHFLSTCFIDYWESSVEVSNYNYVCSFLLAVSSIIASFIWRSLVTCIHRTQCSWWTDLLSLLWYLLFLIFIYSLQFSSYCLHGISFCILLLLSYLYDSIKVGIFWTAYNWFFFIILFLSFFSQFVFLNCSCLLEFYICWNFW